MRVLHYAMAAVSCALSAGTALAQDLNPPAPASAWAPWTRGSNRTTFSAFTFSSAGATTASPSITNPTLPPATLGVLSSTNWQADDGGGRGSGVLRIQPNGFFDILLPNHGPDLNDSFVYIQINYIGPNIQPSFLIRDFEQGTSYDTNTYNGTPSVSGDGRYWQFTGKFTAWTPGLSDLRVRVRNTNAFDLSIDSVHIDTYSTPSPSAAALLGLGVLVATRRRR